MKSFTSKEFFQRHAPDFNFELNKNELVAEAIKRKFIKEVGEDKYVYTPLLKVGNLKREDN